MRKFLKSFFSVAVTLYFSATMFYCFVAGAPAGGNGKVIYLVSAAGSDARFYLRMPLLHSISQKKT